MASLTKLAIRGIRSFDDKQIAVIHFFSPVTVIVGHNGSGKTTIIECLKYATTGDQPPNTRGGAFVHDPKMANEKEVKAQVKLRFRAANGTEMVAQRNLSVSVKKTAGLTMKTLECVLSPANAEKSGKRGVISTKCAEMDAEIPLLLGVSKAVLENVIFCHQEDSYWPLAEPSALKKKFDDIFEATRYTKALDAIKVLRKDRVAELKTDKERLAGLSADKARADKIKARIADLNSTIAKKEIECEETRKAYEALVLANQEFHDKATRFREMYITIENLQGQKDRYNAELEEAKENLQEVEGSEDELTTRLRNFDDHIVKQKQRKKKEESRWQDLEDELANARKEHEGRMHEQGRLAGEAKAQEQRIADREAIIREISNKYNMKGYDHSPLEREKVIEFISRLADVQRRQVIECEKVQNESREQTDEYNRKSRQLHTGLEKLKMQRNNLRSQIDERQQSIANAERKLDIQQALPGELRTLAADMEEKKSRVNKVEADVRTANYDERISEKTAKARSMEDRRDELNTEIRTLSLRADARARLDIKRAEVKSKTTDVKNILELNGVKFRKLVGSDILAESMERELDRVSLEKEREHAELDSEMASANKMLQQAETTLSNLKAQVKAKREELKRLERELKVGVELHPTLDLAIKEATTELSIRQATGGKSAGESEIYANLLRTGKLRKVCTACNRRLDDHELIVFEKYLTDQMKKTSPEALAANREELLDWENELAKLQKLLPVQASRDQLKTTDLPNLDKQIDELEAKIPELSGEAEKVLAKLNDVKRDLKDISILKQQAHQVTKTHKELDRLKQEIDTIEKDLLATGSTKTADDVQAELDTLSGKLRSNDREKQALMSEREQQRNTIRSLENDLHRMQLQQNTLENQIREKAALEQQVEGLKQEITSFTGKFKELDVEIAEAQAPIDLLEQEHKRLQNEFESKNSETLRLSQELNRSVDQLEATNKAVERYVRDKRARLLQECEEKIEELQFQIHDLGNVIERVREDIAAIDKEINESGASVANLRENIRVRKLVRDIDETQAKIDSHDMEAAARYRQDFQAKYKVEKQKETELQAKYAHIEGELSSDKSRLTVEENDLKDDYKDINKKYTDQLIRVKMADMANSDLEKYAKALDNAIMKYHSLKMEEVNDTMRHLWNKTYQGTDIDGICIRSDPEGGGTARRTYNYRVVMTKDQVEMDMRGRCSAGQKMLASIIIRLALSDSFGQNCGILALDEPTNALDTENIDALAGSLVDIINERKNHSNFQLIIITHDENFLQKLGQSDVMEYYWRVARDPRQKSTIERQRVR